MTIEKPRSDQDASIPQMSTPEMSNHRTLLRTSVAGLAATLVLASCAQDAPQDSWDPAGSNAQMIQDLQWWVFMIAGIVGIIVFSVVMFCVVRFKDRGQPIPEQSHGNPVIEYLFIALPAVLLAVIAGFTVNTVFALNETNDTQCEINVTGQQWWWEYDYPVSTDGTICGSYAPTVGEALPIVTSGQMIIPTNTNVLIQGTSRDVIHSFWVPRLNGKRDMVPGRVHTWRFEADQPGIYAGQCAEFCGLSHANMRMEIVALDPADFQKWLDNQLQVYTAPDEGTLAAEGESVFISQCSRCHQVDGLTDAEGNLIVSAPDQWVYSGAAPNLTNFMTRNTFAGATFDTLTPECRDAVWDAPPDKFGERYLVGVTLECLNEVQLKEWLRNAPEMKPMWANPDDLESTDGKYRGMPDLGLSEDQINQLVAYLLERK